MALKAWVWVHKWSSLVSTAFLLILCVTGLPLIFRGEIDQALGYGAAPAAQADTRASLSAIESAGRAARPGWSIHYFVWEPDKPGVVTLNIAPPGSTSFYDNENVLVNAATADIMSNAPGGGPMDVILTLHSQLFLGPLGPFVLGVPSLLFIIALISGFIIYSPFARRRGFGHVRLDRSRTTKWLDLHNVAGISILAWALVVGVTGLVNTWGEYVIRLWQMTELSAYAAPAHDSSTSAASIDAIVAAAQARLPETQPYFIAYPGSLMAGDNFYAAYMRGDTALTQFVFQPVLIDASSAEVIATPNPPWYVQTLALSQPLHFGDYGGLLLKLIWAVLDVAAIFVLASGLYLSLRPRDRISRDALLAEAAP